VNFWIVSIFPTDCSGILIEIILNLSISLGKCTSLLSFQIHGDGVFLYLFGSFLMSFISIYIFQYISSEHLKKSIPKYLFF
jgi:hypothetical protein